MEIPLFVSLSLLSVCVAQSPEQPLGVLVCGQNPYAKITDEACENFITTVINTIVSSLASVKVMEITPFRCDKALVCRIRNSSSFAHGKAGTH
jgi:hypothetical protein